MLVYYSSPEHGASTTDPLGQQPREPNPEPEHMGMELGEGWIKISSGRGGGLNRRGERGGNSGSVLSEMLDLIIVPASVL